MIENFLHVSTSHISKEDANMYLERLNCGPGINGHPYGEGTFLMLDFQTGSEEDIGAHLRKYPSIAQMYKFCKLHKIGVIRLDRDAPVSTDFKTYEW